MRSALHGGNARVLTAYAMQKAAMPCQAVLSLGTMSLLLACHGHLLFALVFRHDRTFCTAADVSLFKASMDSVAKEQWPSRCSSTT